MKYSTGRSDDGRVKKFDTGAFDLGGPIRCAFTTRYLGDPAINKQVRWIKPVFEAQKPVHYTIDYFQKQFSSGPISADTSDSLIWDVGQWDVNKWAGPALNSTRTSVIDGRYGRYLSLSFREHRRGAELQILSTTM